MSRKSINPIIPGFAPDPSIVQINDAFYLVNSTFHMFPGLPIYVSKDLISWTHIGNAIHRRSQLSLAQSSTSIWPVGEKGESLLATGGLYAPTIRYHDGIVYIVCTNILHIDAKDVSENFFVTTKDIESNEWSDPVYFDLQGIDPSLVFDEGRAYLHGSAEKGPKTKIHLFEIDLQTGKKLSEEKTIWDGTGGIYPEGPHIYKRDGFYYLMISEGGTHEDHMITVARASSIWGPYESFQQNPILTARGTDEYIQFTGHCDMFQDLSGHWWGVCLGARVDEGRYVMGRETFLTTGDWKEGNWPTLDRVKLNPTLSGEKGLVKAEDLRPLGAKPMVDYLYIRDADLDAYAFSVDGNKITLTASEGDISQWEKPVTFVGKRQRCLEGSATVLMHNASTPRNNLKAGLSMYKDEHRYLKIFYDFSERSIGFESFNRAKGIAKSSKQPLLLLDIVHLRIEYTERTFVLSYQGEAKPGEWISFETVDTLDMSGPDFVGPVIGIFATADVAQEAHVQFENLEID